MLNQKDLPPKGLTVRDLVTTGIFTALILLCIGIGAMPFAPNPLLTFYMPLGGALFRRSGVSACWRRKVPKRGPYRQLWGFLSGSVFLRDRHALGDGSGVCDRGHSGRTDCGNEKIPQCQNEYCGI